MTKFITFHALDLETRCAKIFRIRSYSGQHFAAFGLKTERRDTEYLYVFSLNAGQFGPE